MAYTGAFKTRCTAEKKIDMYANQGYLIGIQITHHFLFRSCVENLMKLKYLAARTQVDTMHLKDIETVMKDYLQSHKRQSLWQLYKETESYHVIS